MAIKIVDWGKHYENHRTRELAVMTWVPLPNKHDGDGYTQLLDHPNGAAHFGAWCALVELASRQHVGTSSATGRQDIGTTSAPAGKKYRDSVKYDASDHPHGRGILIREGGEAHDTKSLERMTRIPSAVWEEALPRLSTIGWIKGYEPVGSRSAPRRQGVGGKSRTRAGDRRMNGMEWNGMEIEEGKPAAVAATATPPLDPLYHPIEQAFLSKNDDRFTDYSKEGAAIKGLIKKARSRAPGDEEELLKVMLERFWKLRSSGDKFWKSQPFLPSALNSSGIWDRVLETLRNDEAMADPEAMAIARGEVF